MCIKQRNAINLWDFASYIAIFICFFLNIRWQYFVNCTYTNISILSDTANLLFTKDKKQICNDVNSKRKKRGGGKKNVLQKITSTASLEQWERNIQFLFTILINIYIYISELLNVYFWIRMAWLFQNNL